MRTKRFVQLIAFLVHLLALSLVVPKVYGAGDGPMDEQPSTPVKPAIIPSEYDPSPGCEKKEQEPTVAEKCRTTAGVYMGFDKDGNLLFSSEITKLENTYKPILVYSLVQKSIDEKKKAIEQGMFVGYRSGFSDGLSGLPSNPTSFFTTLGDSFNAGYKLGYPDGYAAGVFEKSFKHLKR